MFENDVVMTAHESITWLYHNLSIWLPGGHVVADLKGGAMRCDSFRCWSQFHPEMKSAGVGKTPHWVLNRQCGIVCPTAFSLVIHRAAGRLKKKPLIQGWAKAGLQLFIWKII